MNCPPCESATWIWVGRIASIVTLVTIFIIWRDLKGLAGKVVGRFSFQTGSLGLSSRKGLICLLSAPSAARPDPKKEPRYLENLINASSTLTPDLRACILGPILKAIERHATPGAPGNGGDLRYCWLIASRDSKALFQPLRSACAKLFPGVRVPDPIEVGDVYHRIDDVYNAVRQVFLKCEKETYGLVKPADIVTDVTGGNKIMSIGAAMACLDGEHEIEYIEQENQRDFYFIDITRVASKKS